VHESPLMKGHYQEFANLDNRQSQNMGLSAQYDR